MTLADKIVVMRDGLIEQVGPPMELYNNPINRLVADFLGSPAMNFINAEFLSVPEAAFVGLRPQHFSIAAQKGRLTGQVVHFERLGTDTHVIVDIGEKDTLVVRIVGQQEFELNERIKLDFNDKDPLLFDSNGQRVPSARTAA